MSSMLEGMHLKNAPSSTIMNNGWKHQGSFHDWIDKEIRDVHQEIILKGIRGKKVLDWGRGFLTDYSDVKTIKHRHLL